jgi:site-specific recombinase XerD
MALLGGLRRREIFGLGVNEMHYDNAYIVVWSGEPFKSSFREVPFTEAARTSVKAWLEFRALMGVEHDRPWLNLWAEKTALEAVKSHAFARLLSSYVSPGLSYRRLRHTCALSWLEAGLTLWEVQRLLGHSQLKDTLPFAEAMRSDLKERVGAVQGSIRSILVSAA